MSGTSWLVLPLESERLRDALWNGSLEHEGRRCRGVPRELIVEGDRRKVLLLLADPSTPRVGWWRRWWAALRGGRASLVLATSLWVLLLGLGQHWELRPRDALLAVAGAFLLHLAVNAFAEIQDTMRLLDLGRWYEPDPESCAILEGWVSPRVLWRVGVLLLLLSLACGLPLLWWHSEALLPMAAMAALAAWGYSQPPLALKYRGAGEAVLFMAAGPALVLGLSWCFFGQWNLVLVSLGACLGLWTVALHHVGNLPDADQDREHRVSTLVTRLGFLRARLLVPVFYLVAWLSFLPAVAAAGLNPVYFFLLGLVLTPQIRLSLRLLRASGAASVWMAGIRGRVRRVHWVSHLVALLVSWGCLFLFGSLI